MHGSKSGFYAQDLADGVYLDPDSMRTADLRNADLRGAVIGRPTSSASTWRRQARSGPAREGANDARVRGLTARLCQRLADNLPRDVGQPLVPAVVAVGQPHVVQTEQVEDCRVDVVDVRRFRFGAEAERVSRADPLPALHAAAASHIEKPCGLWSRPVDPLRHGRAAELAAPDDERRFEKTA